MKVPSAENNLRLLKAASRIPTPVWWPLARLASLVLAARPPRPLRQWEINATIATGQPQGVRGRRAAQFSWLRNTIGSLQLGRWSPERIRAAVDVDLSRAAALKEVHAERGLVFATPHMGSWDLAGAYSCIVGLPVTSVAERLPAGQFEYFRDLRSALGFEIHPFDAPNLVPTLCQDLQRGRVVCLVADRDFGRRGLPVRWPTPDGGRDLTLPAGPVVIAQQTGAALVGIACRYDGPRMHITIGDEIALRPGREGAEKMAQELAEFFATNVAASPADWHMMQKLFPGEVA